MEPVREVNHRLRQPRNGVFTRSFRLQRPCYARETIAQLRSLRVSLAMALTSRAGSSADGWDFVPIVEEFRLPIPVRFCASCAVLLRLQSSRHVSVPAFG